MALINNRTHTEVYKWLPRQLKHELYGEFSEKFPEVSVLILWRKATGRQSFGVEEWTLFLHLIEKYDNIWSEQVKSPLQTA